MRNHVPGKYGRLLLSKAGTLPFPENLMADIGLKESVGVDKYECLTEDQMAGLEYALSTLNKQEQLVFRLRYEEQYTLNEVAASLKRSRERARQIILKGLGKLRNPACSQYYVLGLKATAERKNRITYSVVKKTGSEMTNTEIREALGGRAGMRFPELGLSTRACNCMERAGLGTVYDLIVFLQKNPNGLYPIRNLGKCSLMEIYDRMREIGLGDWIS
ncbi:MAG: hypothetical protein IJP92_12315 [Lachnospiraceae bacterium]|nr:hypothetical protein [Lachnospiraceae bacterium]